MDRQWVTCGFNLQTPRHGLTVATGDFVSAWEVEFVITILDMYTLPSTKSSYCLRSAGNHQTAFTCTHCHLRKTPIVSEVHYLSDSLHMYILPPTKDSYCLRSASNYQTAFICTHFHLQKTLTVSEVQVIIRQPSHVHTSTYERLLLSQKCR
jgi:hypothetical protein